MRTRIALLVGAFLLSAGGPGGGGCDCNCDWGKGKPPVHPDNRRSGWVEPEAAPQQPTRGKDASASAGAASAEKRQQTAAFCEQHPRSCSPIPIKQVKVERGKWPEWYVRRTPKANMHATWDCNGWKRGSNPVIQPGQEIGICGW